MARWRDPLDESPAANAGRAETNETLYSPINLDQDSLDEKIKEEYARYEEVLGDLYDIHEKRNEKEEKEDIRDCTIFIQENMKNKEVNRGLYDIQKITKSKKKISRGLYDTKPRKKKSLVFVRYEKKGGEGVGAAGFVYGPRFQSLLVDT